jgi:uncharacterized tellurite resistance protein B-like protein
MLNSINNFFDNYLKPGKDAEEESTVCQIQLASAALMIELSMTDQKIDDSETNTLLGILESKFQLSKDTLNELVTLAKQETLDATSLYQFTSLINEAYDYDGRTKLIQNMWEVAFADGDLDRYEEHLIRKVAELLYVSHSDFIKTKLAIKNR